MIKLPVISLLTFYGNYEEWQQFYDTFLTLIDSNATLDLVQKVSLSEICTIGCSSTSDSFHTSH